jgi:hypothetical protein
MAEPAENSPATTPTRTMRMSLDERFPTHAGAVDFGQIECMTDDDKNLPAALIQAVLKL